MEEKMKNITTLKAASLTILLLLTQTNFTHPVDKPDISLTRKHFIAHFIGDITGRAVAAISMGVGKALSDICFEKFTDASFSNNYNQTMTTLSVAPGALGILTGLYVFYKTPQWTDDYLGYQKERTTKQNIASSLIRYLCKFPYGSAIAEILI